MVDGTDGVRRLAWACSTDHVLRDFLQATVLLSAGSATLLAAITVIGLTRGGPHAARVLRSLVDRLDRDRRVARPPRAETSPPIARLLATARTRRPCRGAPGADPDQPAVAMLLFTIVCAIAVYRPQVAAVAAVAR